MNGPGSKQNKKQQKIGELKNLRVKTYYSWSMGWWDGRNNGVGVDGPACSFVLQRICSVCLNLYMTVGAQLTGAHMAETFAWKVETRWISIDIETMPNLCTWNVFRYPILSMVRLAIMALTIICCICWQYWWSEWLLHFLFKQLLISSFAGWHCSGLTAWELDETRDIWATYHSFEAIVYVRLWKQSFLPHPRSFLWVIRRVCVCVILPFWNRIEWKSKKELRMRAHVYSANTRSTVMEWMCVV